MESLLWWLCIGSKGGVNRARIMNLLKSEPYNAYNISEILELNYKTVRHHLKLLQEYNIIATPSNKRYGALYFLSDDMKDRIDLLEMIVAKLEIDG